MTPVSSKLVKRLMPRWAAQAGTLGLAMGLAVAVPTAAMAAEESDNPAPGEIVVTAQKREQSLKDVPSSVAALSADRVSTLSAGGADIRFLSAKVPSLLVESSVGRAYPRFYIRGLGNTDFDANASQPVEMVYDEVVLESPILKGFPAFDLQRIEVLRGPQGTLFGRNTPAGIVKLDSAKPTEEFSGYGRLSFGRWNSVDAEGAISGALSPSLNARLSVLAQRRDDNITNDFNGSKVGGYRDFAGRLQLQFKPSETFEALFNLHGRSMDGSAIPFRANVLQKGKTGLAPSFRYGHVSWDGLNDQSLDTLGGNAKIVVDLDGAKLTSVTSYDRGQLYSRGDIDGGFGGAWVNPTAPFGPGFIPFPVETSGDNEVKQFTQELRLASDSDGAVNYQLGTYYFQDRLNGTDLDYFSMAPGNPVTGKSQLAGTTKSIGIFGSVDAALSEKLKLNAGIRYSHDKKTLSRDLGSSVLNARTSKGDVAWDASLTYSVSDETNVYGRIARGFRAPAMQSRGAGVITTANSEHVISGELGIKTATRDRRFYVNADVYMLRVDNQQLTAVGGLGNNTSLLNADKVQGHGFEVELGARPTSNLELNAGVSYNYTKIDDPNLYVSTCFAPACTILNKTSVVAGTKYAAIDGNPLPQAPRWVANGSFKYSAPLGDGKLYFSGDAAYRSQVYFFLYKTVEFQDRGQLELGARVGYTFDNDRSEISIFGRNLTNHISPIGGLDFDNFTAYVSEPRIWGIEVKTRW